MSVRSGLPWVLAVALVAPPAGADKLDKESKKWLEEVRAILTLDEAKTYGELKDRAERVEFEKIFWARRDTDLGTPENEFQAEFLKRKAEADKRYKVPGRAGSATDCGRLYILLGEPDEVKKDTGTEGRGLRLPETWIYKSKPGMNFAGGQAVIAVDSDCAFAATSVAAQLDRVAGGNVVSPNLGYRVKEGRLTRLADMLPKPSPAQTLLKNPRQDFSVSGQTGYLKSSEGFSVLLGLVRAEGTHATVQEQGGKKLAAVTVVAEAVNAEGKSVATDERAVLAPLEADGSLLAAYRMFLKPGRYTLKFGLVDDKSGRGSVSSEQADVPDLNKGELAVASLWVVSDIVDVAGEPEAKDPLGAFVLGKTRLVPRFGGVFSKADAPLFFYNLGDGTADPATGKPKVTVTLALSKGPKKLAEAESQTFDASYVASAVGPVPLEKYEPGTYTAKLRVRDEVAKKDLSVEQNFEIK